MSVRDDPRFLRGKECLKTQRYEDAIEIFGSLLESLVDTKPQSLLAPIYHEYGHALLLSEETNGDVFGAEMGDEKGDNVSDDLELAWEMLEMARVLYTEDSSDNTHDDLVHVYTRLGDLGMESGNFESSRADYQKALDMKLTKAEGNTDTNSSIADLYCCIAMNCVYQSSTVDNNANALALLEKGHLNYVNAGRIIGALFLKNTTNENNVANTITTTDSNVLCFNGDLEKLKSENEFSKDALEYLEIYVELVEKAAGVLQSIKDLSNKNVLETQIGFKEKENESKATVLLPVRKKQKKD